MNDETTAPAEGAAPVADLDAARAARASEDVTPNLKGAEKPAKAAGATKAAKATKATKAAKASKSAKKAAGSTKKAAAEGSGIVRKPSTVAKEGTQKDAFDGKEYPLTNFPTVRQADGSYVRGTVTRANLPAFRAQRKAEREKAKAVAAKAKEAAAAAKAKEKAAAAKA